MILSPQEVLATLGVPFMFKRRPVPVPGDLRASWKVFLVLGILHRCCRGSRSSLKRLHVLNWAVRSPDNLRALVAALEGELDPTTVLVRFDPSLNRAIDLARGYGLVESPRGDRVVLTATGMRAVAALSKADGLAEELEGLTEIGHRLSEGRADEILRWYTQ